MLNDGGRLLLIDMFSHERVEYQRQMGHVWLGFEPAQIEAWLREAGFASIRIQGLPPDPQAKGPALFAAVARRQRFTKTNQPAEQSARPGKTASRRRKE